MKIPFLFALSVVLSSCASSQFVASDTEGMGRLVAVDLMSGEVYQGDAADARLDGLRGFASGTRDAESVAQSKRLSASSDARVQRWDGVEHATEVMEYQDGVNADGSPRMIKCHQGGTPPSGFYGALCKRRSL